MSLLADILFFLWTGLLLFKGLHPSDNWLGWFMFSRARYFQTELRDRSGVIDVWDYLPPCQVMLSRTQIEALLRHIQSQRQSGYIEGSVIMLTTAGKETYLARRSLLIPQDEEAQA